MTAPRLSIALALTLVLAGCAAPTHDGTPTGAGDGIEVRGAGLPVDADLVFDRVTRLMGADPPRPQSIRVIAPPDPDEVPDNASSGGFDPAPAFFEHMDVDSDPGEGLNASEALALENGATRLGVGTVVLFTGENDSETVHYVLAHEFAHYVQSARDRATQLRERVGTTTDATFVFASLLEGSAVFTTNAYIAEHIGGGLTNSRLYFDLRERLEPGSFADYANSRYIVGWRYVSSRVESPGEFDPLYEDPPRTGEQVIHGLSPEAEPVRPLSISTDTGAYRRVDVDRLGEGFLRVALRNGLTRSRAHRAAAGWGNDTLRTYFTDGGEPGYVWTLRFDDARNRTQFVEALRDSLDSRGERVDGIWNPDDTDARFDLRPVGQESVVVLVGETSFVGNTTVRGSSANVSITLPG